SIEKEEGISKEYLIEAVDATLKAAYEKTFNETNAVVKVNLAKGDVRLYAEKTIVDKVTNPNLEISLKEALNFSESPEIGATILIEIPLKSLSSAAIMTAKQVFQQKILDKKREITYNVFTGKVGDIVNGRVTRIKGRGNIGVNIEPYNIEGIIPPEEQIPNERIFREKIIKAYIKEVKMSDGGPIVVLSRASSEFLEKLLELEIPEVEDKLVDVKGIVREPGIRAKIAVAAKDIHIDPVGACIGQKGVRINSVSREINYERIDIIRWNSNPALYIENAMSPGKVKRVELLADGKGANVFVAKSEYPIALGIDGINVMLASKLTGYFIHLFEASEEGEHIEEGK
ncbi:MAG: transcription termination factor NusA, partial [Caldisericaceae bacterium]